MTVDERPCTSATWYVNDTLDADERERFEAHLEDCGDCRETIEAARSIGGHHDRIAAPRAAAETHVPSALFVRWSEAPASLAADTREWIDAHLRECDACREEADWLRSPSIVSPSVAASAASAASAETGADARAAESLGETGPWTERVWSWLSSTLLQPAPALAYLLLLAVAAPLLWTLRSSGESPRLSPRAPLVWTTESADRGGGTPSNAPAEIPAGTGALALTIELPFETTELDGLDLLVVEWIREGRAVATFEANPSSLRAVSGGARLDVLLEPGGIRPGAVYRLQVRAEAPGRPLDGQVLFVRRAKGVR